MENRYTTPICTKGYTFSTHMESDAAPPIPSLMPGRHWLGRIRCRFSSHLKANEWGACPRCRMTIDLFPMVAAKLGQAARKAEEQMIRRLFTTSRNAPKV